MTQDRIAESGKDRPSDMDFDGWFKAARRLDLNRLANEAFHLASRRPPYLLCTHADDIFRSPTCALLVHPLTPTCRRDPCSNARPFARTPSWHSYGRRPHLNLQTPHANLLLLWPDWSHQQRVRPPPRPLPHDAG
jgi:hypothetical protein